MLRLSGDERVEILQKNYLCSCSQTDNLKLINDVINVVMAAVAWMLTKNLVIIALIFVGYDILANFFESVIVSAMVSLSKNMTLTQMQKAVEKLEEDKKKLHTKLVDACNHCNHQWGRDIPGCTYNKCGTRDLYQMTCSRIDVLQKKIEEQTKALLEAEAEQAKQDAMNKDTKSNNYADKLQYFKDLEVKLQAYIDNYAMDLLVPIQQSVHTMIETLVNKPNGVEFIANSMYIHLDELMSILSKYSTLELRRKEVYTQQIEKISEILSKNVDSTISRIQNFEESSLDVGIAVLLTELTNGKE